MAATTVATVTPAVWWDRLLTTRSPLAESERILHFTFRLIRIPVRTHRAAIPQRQVLRPSWSPLVDQRPLIQPQFTKQRGPNFRFRIPRRSL